MRLLQGKTIVSTFIVAFSFFITYCGDGALADELKLKPSFDCGGGLSRTQTAICASSTLSALDYELSTHIDGLRQLLTRTQYLVEARTFVEKRDKCGDNMKCIGEIYESRIWRVRSRVDDLRPIEGSWVNETYAHISIVKLGSKYRLVGDTDVAKLREQRAQAAQQQAQAEQLNQGADTAQKLGQVQTQNGQSNAANDVIGMFSGYQSR